MKGYRNTVHVLLAALAMTLSACNENDDVAQHGGAGFSARSDWMQGGGERMRDTLPPAERGDRQAMPPPLDTSRLVVAEVIDQSGFGRPMTAWRLQIPAGWQTTGGVSWNDAANCYANMTQTAWSAIGPDSLSVFEIMPSFGWQVAGTEIRTDPCPSAPFRSARDFLQATVQQSRPGARILDYVDRPDWVQQAEQQHEELMRRMGMSLPPGQTRRVEAGSLLLAFQHEGIEMREMLSAVVNFSSMHGSVSGLANSVSYRAPSGRLDLELAARIMGTMQQDQQWQEAAQPRLKRNIEQYFAGQRRQIDEWHSRQMAIINARGMADRHAIRMRGNREVADIYSQIAANTRATNDNIHRRTMEGIGEYRSYAGSDGSTVRGSIHGGSRVFQDDIFPDRVYSTDDPWHAPNNATELERIP